MRNIRLFIIALFGVASLWVGCSESTKVVGTSEEENEIVARGESSSSPEPEATFYSSSQEVESNSSSSTEWRGSVDSYETSSNSIESSGSIEPPPESFGSSSSGRPGTVDGGIDNPNTIGYYVATFALGSVQFDSAVKASAIVDMEEPGLYQITKENTGMLKSMFPRAVKRYKELVAAIENDIAECNLYLYNVQGSAQAAGHIMTGITPDTVRVLDVVSENCESTNGKMFGFLFTYCGEMNGEPKLVRTTVESEILENKCPSGQINEWIKEN